MTQPAAPKAWREHPERGSLLGIQLLMHVLDHLGREFLGLVLWPVCVYFALVAKEASAASRAYLERMGLPHDFWAVVKHLWTFARCSVDRILFLGGHTDQFEVHRHGHELIRSLIEDKRGGALLIGAHIGSFEAMRALAAHHEYTVLVVADFGNAARINGLFGQLHPNLHLDVIEHNPANGIWMLDVKDRTDHGGVVALLSDRVPGGVEPRGQSGFPRSVEVDFLGGRASFPTGTFAMAHVARCSVYTVFALFDGKRRYDVYCELLTERVDLPRGERQAALEKYVQAYADRVAQYVRMAPWNWFNFYDFWAQPKTKGASQR